MGEAKDAVLQMLKLYRSEYTNMSDVRLADLILAALGDKGYHTIELRERDFTIMHPLDCRPNLFACEYNAAGRLMAGPPVDVGTYRCELVDGMLRILDKEE